MWVTLSLLLFTCLATNIAFILFSRCKDKFPKLYAISAKNILSYRYNAFIRLFLEFYLDLSVFALVNITHLKIKSSYIAISDALAIVFLLIIIVGTSFFAIIVERWRHILPREDIKLKIGTLYDGID